MDEARLFFVLSLVLTLIGHALQDESISTTPAPPATTTDRQKAPPAAEATKENEDEDSNAAPVTKCKPNEMHSENGCVDREFFLNKIITRFWKDEGFEKAKARSGIVETMECQENEVRTPLGCEKPPYPPHRASNRVPVEHSRIEINRIVHDSAVHKIHHHDSEEKQKAIRKPVHLGPPRHGEDRPRKYVFLPGRSLRKARRCRANEVRGSRSRCIRRRRKHHRKPQGVEKETKVE
ncbi:uncharacterized protein LOC108117023 [Drosophila eugracilis]|uniref:uncharacterized protein LOC108117023 n=1 Tax=Drosophila eugracilis TaxID=29029 RepID=UPI001BD9267D|nr:uncharacterized protein LOC108117023 [Drosophila eugracilis]